MRISSHSNGDVTFENNIIPSQIKSLEYVESRILLLQQCKTNSLEYLNLGYPLDSDDIVTTITRETFSNFKSLKSLKLSDITINDKDALADLSQLTSLIIDNRGLDVIEGLFSNLKLENLTVIISNPIPEIGQYINNFSFNLGNLKTFRIQSTPDIPFTTPIEGLSQLTTFGFSNGLTLISSTGSSKRIANSETAIDLSVLGNSKIENIEILSGT